MEDATPRRLMKQIGGCEFISLLEDSSTVVSSVTFLDGKANGWEWITQQNLGVGQVVVVNRSYIDLAGFSQEELTTFIQSVDIQKSRDPAGDNLKLAYNYDFFTSRRITDTELSNFAGANEIPGYIDSTLDLQEMIYGEHQTLALNANIPSTYITTSGGTLGSGNPTAADRIHWTRVFVIVPSAFGATPTTINSTNLVSQAMTGKEKDLVWIERLRRAYTQDPGRV